MNSYELGWKSEWYGGRVTLNGAVFYQEIEDYQYLEFNGNGFDTFNVPDASSTGFEVDVAANPADNFIVTGSVAYIDTEIERSAELAGTSLECCFGEQIANIPELTLTGTASYDHPIGDTGLEATYFLSGRYTDSHKVITADVDPTRNKSIAVFDARVGIRPRDNQWSLELVGENLTDERYFLAGFPVPEAAGTNGGYPAPPRFVGLQARWNF